MTEQKIGKNLHDGHRKRVRDRFVREGLMHFEGHQALELLLFYAVKRADTNELAHMLIKEFGSFSAVLDAPPEELARFPYMTENAVVLLRLIPEMAAYYRNDKLKHICVLQNYNALFAYVRAMFMSVRSETVMLIMLDGKSQLLKTVKLCEGSVNITQISARTVAAHALRCEAVTVVLAHNHPGGNALPSNADLETTIRLKNTLAEIGIRLFDHLVVCGEEVTPIMKNNLTKQLVEPLNI